MNITRTIQHKLLGLDDWEEAKHAGMRMWIERTIHEVPTYHIQTSDGRNFEADKALGVAEMAVEHITATTTPVVGEGATYTLWTDRLACTVIDVQRNGRLAIIQEDKATLLNGRNSDEPDALEFSPGGFFGHTSGTQRYSYERDPDGAIYRISKRVDKKTGKITWKKVGDSTRSPGGNVTFGSRSKHYDYNF